MKTMSEKEYRSLKLDSSSSLKVFSEDRRKYYKKYVKEESIEEEVEEDSKAVLLGKLVETLLWEEEEFDNRYYLSSVVNPPTEKMLDFVEALYRQTRDNTDEEGGITLPFVNMAEEAYKQSGFTWKLETVLNKFIGKDPEVYYNEICKVRKDNLTVVDINTVNNAEKAVEGLKEGATGKILTLVSSSRYDIEIQYPITNFEIDGLPMKSLLDHLIVDHQEKIIQPNDLKVTWSVENFLYEYYLKRRAYIQAYVYDRACHFLKEMMGWDDYVVKPINFIVCDSINYYKPLIYVLNSDNLDDAYRGFTYQGRKYPGVKEIIENIKWAKEHNEYRISKSNFENNQYTSLFKD